MYGKNLAWEELDEFINNSFDVDFLEVIELQ